jgi:DNA-binding NarL/FixJ family response regulator
MFGLVWESRKLCIKPMRLTTYFADRHGYRLIKCGTVIEFRMVARYHHLGSFPSYIRGLAGRCRHPAQAGESANKNYRSAMAAYEILIADDHPLFRSALQQALMLGLGDGVRLSEAASIADLEVLLTRTTDWDLVLLDLNMPGAYGFSGLVLLRGQYPQLPVVMISAQEDAAVVARSREFGASGFIPKSSSLETIQEAVRVVLDGDVWWPSNIQDVAHVSPEAKAASEGLASLTPQQFRVLAMVCDGLLNKQIAYELSVSEATIKAHVTAIFRKLGVRTRTQAALLLQQMGSIPSS